MRQVGDGADFLEGWQGSRRRCFKCGGTGHFAKDCTAQAEADAGALASSSDSEDEHGSAAAGAGAPSQVGTVQPHQQAAAGSLRLASASSLAAAVAAGGPVPRDPAEQHADVLADPSEAALTGVLRSLFGHSAFRGLQLATVQRLLAGESLLSIMPTGMGKSLCYALPAALLPGLTLVVSPLIALMHDQAAAVPPPVRMPAAACGLVGDQWLPHLDIVWRMELTVGMVDWRQQMLSRLSATALPIAHPCSLRRLCCGRVKAGRMHCRCMPARVHGSMPVLGWLPTLACR